MCSSILFPIDEGVFTSIFELPTGYLQYGIYRCIVHYDKQKNKMFRFNKNNHYTHIDLTRARELNLKIDLIIDTEANFLYYSRDKLLTGSEIFGLFVDYMFDLKQKKLDGAKEILNILYGALSERNSKNRTIKYDEKYEIPGNSHNEIRKSNLSKDEFYIASVSKANQYKYGYARIIPFILAKGRSIISKIIEPIYNDVVRCHTDGIVFTNLNKDMKFGCELGSLVYEGKCEDCEVVNSNTIIGKFQV
jgi:hypothetical protein